MSRLSKKNILSNTSFKWGGSILFLYGLWLVCWIIYAYFIKGKIGAPYHPVIHLDRELLPPFSHGDILGTDVFGRSVLEILSAGLSYSITLGLLVTLCASFLGIIVGFLSVQGPQWLNYVLDMSTNLMFIFPRILIAIVFMSLSGQSLWGLALILTFTNWPGYARISRGEIKRVLGLSYVESSKAIGMGDTRLFLTVILPSISPQMIIHMVLGISGVIISESILGFLGLGGSTYSWGAMLAMAKNVLLEAPYLVVILSIMMAGLIIGLNIMGDGLRDILDPRSSA